MSRNFPEILAPAGNMDSLIAALRTGADAVYIGGKNFSARNSADNFPDEEIPCAADKCHLYGAKLYLAVNTLIRDDEADEFSEFVKYAAKSGVDAFIVQDLGCAYIIRRSVPDAVLHASTQMTIHTLHGADLARSLGFSRIVPARELDCKSIGKICGSGIETEVFVHGALCMSVSGQCYMSAVIGSRSANRGCCGQACRLPFSACGDKNASALSLRDLSLIPDIRQLVGTGVDSLKIEGRMKRPEYVAATVTELKNALDGKDPDMFRLRQIFSRGGFTDGYFTGKRNGMFGVREKSDVVASQKVIPEIHGLYRRKRKARIIDMHAEIKEGRPFKVTASCEGLCVSAVSDVPQKAKEVPTDSDTVIRQLSRLGDTIYEPGVMTADISDGVTVPVKEINRLRREVTKKTDDLIITRNRPVYDITGYIPSSELNPEKELGKSRPGRPKIRTFCRTAEQAEAAYPLSDEIVVPYRLLLSSECYETMDKDRIIADPPRFIADEQRTADDLKALSDCGFRRLMCHNPDCIMMGKELGFTLHGGFGLNIFNSFSLKTFAGLGLADAIVSFECKISQINSLVKYIPTGAVTYGRLPLMLTVNCPIKNETGCKNCKKTVSDRTGRVFPVVCGEDCFEILNSDILYMADRANKFSDLDFYAIFLYNEDRRRTISAIKGERPEENITRGLYFRGV